MEQYFTKLLILIEQLGLVLIHIRFGENLIYGVGGVSKNVFFTKLQMADFFSRQTFVIPMAIL